MPNGEGRCKRKVPAGEDREGIARGSTHKLSKWTPTVRLTLFVVVLWHCGDSWWKNTPPQNFSQLEANQLVRCLKDSFQALLIAAFHAAVAPLFLTIFEKNVCVEKCGHHLKYRNKDQAIIGHHCRALYFSKMAMFRKNGHVILEWTWTYCENASGCYSENPGASENSWGRGLFGVRVEKLLYSTGDCLGIDWKLTGNWKRP